MSKSKAVLRTLRPKQWVKNFFVLAPLVFAKQLLHWSYAGPAAAAFAIFCALSGAVYAFNDLRDVAADRLHPIKSKRPIASGELGEREALLLSAILACAALACAALISPLLVLVAAGYLANNLLYTLLLKRVAFLDVAMIGVGFLLRVLAGAFAIDVPISPWLLACTALLACFLGFGKRAHELLQAEAFQREAGSTRAALAGYTVRTLKITLVVFAVATTVAYALYTRDDRTVRFFGTDQLIYTLPFCVLGIGRFLQLALLRPAGESPTDAILRDWPFILNILAWGGAVLSIIYLR
jgi:4-hydroxybenzoate polyprenyltransferase